MRYKKEKKNIIKKILAGLLILCMMCSVMPAGIVQAEETAGYTDIDDSVVTTTGELFKIQYEPSSRWHAESGYADLFFDGTDYYSDMGSDEDYYQMKFIGNRIQIYGSKNTKHADCNVYVDGEYAGELLAGLDSGETVHKQLLFDVAWSFEDEEHTLKVVRKSGDTRALQVDKIRIYHEDLKATAITLSTENVKLGIGGSKKVEVASFEPWNISAPELEWSSADETVAKVDASGLITAVLTANEKRETVITATVKGTDISAAVKVTVDPEAGGMSVTIGDEKVLDTQLDYEKVSESEVIESWNGVAWKGDILNSKITVIAQDTDIHNVTVTASDFENEAGDILASENISMKWLKEIQAREGRNMAGELKSYPDIIHKGGAADVAAESLKFAWISMNIPEDTKPGVYTGTLTVNANELKKPVEFTYTIEVLDLVQPAEEATDIQIWQHPFSVANYYLGLGTPTPGGVCNVVDEEFYFTEEHFNLMRDATLDYVSMGGHDWVANIVEEAWNHQSYYNDLSMVKWTKKTDGTWEFDYTWYDAWVEFGIECGVIDPETNLGQIKCYSIVPWNNQVAYYDEASGRTVKESHTPGAEAWTAIWTPFLEDFIAHSIEKGWFDITYISMDERTIDQLEPTVDLIESIQGENGKSLKISSALNYAAPDYYDFTDRIHDISINLGHCTNRAQMNALAEHRRALGLKTTLYTCTGNYPGNFAHSDPGENYWQIWYTMTLGMDGFMRWAWDNYVNDMHGNVTYRYWEPGDGWYIYPIERDEVGENYEAGFYSTPRYELFKQGVRDVAKAKYLMSQSDVIAQEIDALMDTLAHPSQGSNYGSAVAGSEAQRFGLHMETDRIYEEVTAWAKAYLANPEAPELPKDPNAKDPEDASNDYPVDKLTATTGSEQTGVESTGEGPVAFALDGNTETYYHSSWRPQATEDQLWITLELEEPEKIAALRYLPRPGRDNGTVLEYEVSYSMDGEKWKTVSTGIWGLNKEWKLAQFEEAVEAKYVKFYAVDSVADDNGRHFSAAEVRLVKATETETPEPTPTETEAPQPTETEAPQPTETEAPQPTETEVPQPTETETPQPTVTEAPQPTETEAPQPTETEAPTPTEPEAPQPTETEAPTPTETEAPEPKDDVTTIFDDVYEDWYTDYVQYVYDNNLMTGIKGTKHFAPHDNITKAQVAQVLYNMEGQPEVDLGSAKAFKELHDVYDAEWYASAVAWAYETGVVTGDLNAMKFSPDADVTREQLALMIYRYAKHKGCDVSASSDFTGLANADKVADWSMDGMKWAVGEGLISGAEVNGVKDLDPQGNASRAQVAAILQRFCEGCDLN